MDIIGQINAGVPIEHYRRGKPYHWTKATWEKLTYEGESTASYVPLTHKRVLNMLISALTLNNLEIKRIRVNLGGGIKSLMIARVLTEIHPSADMFDMWTITHGHNRRSSMRFASGFEMLPHNNGMFYRTNILSAVHKKNVIETFTKRLDESIIYGLAARNNRLAFNEKLKNKPLTIPYANHLILDSATTELIRRPVRVSKTFTERGDYTLWGLWYAITCNEEICGSRSLKRVEKHLDLLKSELH